MDICFIFSMLCWYKIVVVLIVLEVVLICVIVCNVLFLVSQCVEKISMFSGIVENELVMFCVSGIGKQIDVMFCICEDLVLLCVFFGVSNVIIINQVFFCNGLFSSSILWEIDQEWLIINVLMYILFENGLVMMGINLIVGCDFLFGEYQNFEDVSKGGVK